MSNLGWFWWRWRTQWWPDLINWLDGGYPDRRRRLVELQNFIMMAKRHIPRGE